MAVAVEHNMSTKASVSYQYKVYMHNATIVSVLFLDPVVYWKKILSECVHGF